MLGRVAPAPAPTSQPHTYFSSSVRAVLGLTRRYLEVACP